MYPFKIEVSDKEEGNWYKQEFKIADRDSVGLSLSWKKEPRYWEHPKASAITAIRLSFPKGKGTDKYIPFTRRATPFWASCGVSYLSFVFQPWFCKMTNCNEC